MLTALSLIVGLATAPTDPTAPVPVVPGQSLGGIALGTAEADLGKTGLPVSPGAIDTWRKVGPYEVQIDGGKVVQISLDLSSLFNTLKIGDQIVRPQAPEDMAAHLGGCGPLEMRTGGNIIECTSGAMAGQHMGGLTVRVVPPSQASDQPVCAGYIVPGRDGQRLPLEAGKTYCAGSSVLTTAIVQADVLGKLRYNTCQTQPSEGATVVSCPYQGVRFVFASPAGTLARIEGVAIKQ